MRLRYGVSLRRQLDEAEFLLGVFEAALDAPHYDLEALAEGPQRRLTAHVDALLLAGPSACRRLLLSVVVDPDAEPLRVAAASLTLAELALARAQGPDPLAGLRPEGAIPSPERLWAELLAAHDACESPPLRAALIRGLSLSATPGLEDWLAPRLAGARGFALAARLELLRDRGRVPATLAEHLRDEDPAVALAAARAASLSRDPAVLAALSPLGSASDPELRAAAIESALHHYMPGSWASALYWALTPEPSPFRGRARSWVALLGDAGVHARLLEQLGTPARPGPVGDAGELLWALGFCGRVAAVDAAMAWLDHEDYGRLAGELVMAIAGLSPDEPGCWRAALEPDEDETLPPLAADRLDADLVPDAIAALPLPEPAGVRRWWAQRRAQLDPQGRLLGGRPLTPARLVEALRFGPMRRRHALALELALRTGGQVRLRTRQTATVQRAELRRLPDLELLDLQRGLRPG